MQCGLGKWIATGTKASAFFSRFATGASAKTVWRSMRAEQVSVAKRWRRPRSELIRRARSDTGKITENALEPKDCMETARNQAEMTQCAASKARAPDRELNLLYLDIRKQYRDDPVFLNALRRAQRAWIRFRETQIKMKYPEAP